MLEIERTDRDELTFLTLTGQLDALNAPNLKRETEGLVEQGMVKVVLDLTKLEMIDSSGVGAIVSLFKQVRTRQGDLKISGLIGQPQVIFKLLRLDRVFDIADDAETAASRFVS